MTKLIDMDGVQNLFGQHVLKWLFEYYTDNVVSEPYGYDIVDWFDCGGDERQVIKSIFQDNYFWKTLLPNKKIIKEMKKIQDFYIVTYPSNWNGCVKEKAKWIEKYMPWIDLKKRLIMMKDKELLAGNGVLIDDCPDNVNNFIKAGGEAYLFETFYNYKENLPKINSLLEV